MISTLSNLKPEDLKVPTPAPPKEVTAAESTAQTGQSQSAPHLKSIVSAEEAIQSIEGGKIPLTSPLLTDSPSGGTSPSPLPSEPYGGHRMNVGGLMNAKLVAELMDAIIPALAVWLLYRFGKVRLKKTELQLTAKEKDIITPVLQECLNTVNVNMSNPWQSLALALIVIYGSKVGEKAAMSWVDSLKHEEPEKPKNEPLPTPEQVVTKIETAAADFAEEEIKATMKKSKVGRDRAIILLKNKRAAHG